MLGGVCAIVNDGYREVVSSQFTSRGVEVSAGSFSFAFDSDPRWLSASRGFVSALAEVAGCPDGTTLDLKMAVSEACTNAIRAHRDGDIHEPIRLQVVLDGRRMRVEVDDAGGGIGGEAGVGVLPVTGTGLVAGGLGLGIIRALFPDVVIGSNERGGTTVRIDVDLEP